MLFTETKEWIWETGRIFYAWSYLYLHYLTIIISKGKSLEKFTNGLLNDSGSFKLVTEFLLTISVYMKKAFTIPNNLIFVISLKEILFKAIIFLPSFESSTPCKNDLLSHVIYRNWHNWNQLSLELCMWEFHNRPQ